MVPVVYEEDSENADHGIDVPASAYAHIVVPSS